MLLFSCMFAFFINFSVFQSWLCLIDAAVQLMHDVLYDDVASVCLRTTGIGRGSNIRCALLLTNQSLDVCLTSQRLRVVFRSVACCHVPPPARLGPARSPAWWRPQTGKLTTCHRLAACECDLTQQLMNGDHSSSAYEGLRQHYLQLMLTGKICFRTMWRYLLFSICCYLMVNLLD